VPNLFGDGRSAYVLQLHTEEVSLDGFLFALQQDAQGYFHITPIYSGWDFSGGGLALEKFTDRTQDGLPEVIVNVDYCNCSCGPEKALILQWRDGRFVDLARGQIKMGSEFSGWRFGPLDENNVATIEVYKAPLFMKMITRLVWDGTWYQAVGSSVQMPTQAQALKPEGALSVEWLNLALETGQVQEIESLLQPAAEPGFSVGPLSDYLRFQLGFTKALLSRPDQAKDILHSLVISPTNPQVSAVTSAAQGFLKNYADDGDVYKSCQAALTVMENAVASYRDSAGAISQEHYLKQWGYSPGYSDIPLCSLRGAFKLLVSRLSLDQAKDAITVLRASGVTVIHSARLDLNGDGRSDWVALLDAPGSRAGTDLWVLLGSETGLTALPVEAPGSYNLPSSRSAYGVFHLESVTVPGQNQPVVIMQSGEFLYAWRVIEVAGQSHIEQLLRRELVGRFEMHSLQSPFEIKAYIKADQSVWTVDREWEIYRWDPVIETLVLTETAKSSFETVEALIFEQNRSGDAIALLQTLLAAPDEKRIPHAYYLLGLAYELTGDKANAAKVYWQLWQAYPDSGYGVMAQFKLENIAP